MSSSPVGDVRINVIVQTLKKRMKERASVKHTLPHRTTVIQENERTLLYSLSEAPPIDGLLCSSSGTLSEFADMFMGVMPGFLRSRTGLPRLLVLFVESHLGLLCSKHHPYLIRPLQSCGNGDAGNSSAHPRHPHYYFPSTQTVTTKYFPLS